MNYFHSKLIIKILLFLIIILSPAITLAASLSVSPSTGVYTSGSTFTSRIVVNTNGQSINAAEGTIKFNPQELTVVSVDRSNSIFNLWVSEPTFSNTAGTISFSGGLPSGYKGSSGSIFNITFRTKNSGNAKVSITSGAVLANDGMGTNVLSTMGGAAYTISPVATTPVPEEIEYVAPANTPATPKIISKTHPDPSKWYQANDASLNWDIPSDVISLRTSLDTNPTSIPTKVYEDPISSIDLEDLPEGESYFHIQFKNNEGWGKVAHYRLAIDTEKPSNFEISLEENSDLANPVQVLKLNPTDDTTDVKRYIVKLNNQDPFEYIDEENSRKITLPALLPGYHTVIIEAFDMSGNSIISNFNFSISSFEKPIFTEYPDEINEEVIPVIRGTTRPEAEVEVSVSKGDAVPTIYNLIADKDGVFTLIPEGTFTTGVYELTARAKDKFGAQSDISEPIRIAVQQPGIVKIGTFLIDVLSVLVPLFAMVVLLVLSVWFLILYLRRFRRRVSVESKEALTILDREFKLLNKILQDQKSKLTNAHKTKKLSAFEEEMFSVLSQSLSSAQDRVEKEVTDVENLVQRAKGKQ